MGGSVELKKINNQILLFECENFKELTLTFFRIQEFYESAKDELRGKKFDVFDFLCSEVKDNGEVKYFNGWAGFNFPGDVYEKWKKINTPLTKLEKELDKQIFKNINRNKPFYVIACLKKDKKAIDHELAHAMYYLDSSYKMEISSLISSIPVKIYLDLRSKLFDFGYSYDVLDDEINAYLSISGAKYLRDTIKTKVDKKLIKSFEKTFKKYKDVL